VLPAIRHGSGHATRALRRMYTESTRPVDEAVARNLVDCDDGFLLGRRYLLMDRDAKFSEGFRLILKSEDVNAVRLPPKSPNLNAHIERFFRSLREECLDRMIFFGEAFVGARRADLRPSFPSSPQSPGTRQQDH